MYSAAGVKNEDRLINNKKYDCGVCKRIQSNPNLHCFWQSVMNISAKP